MPAREIPVRLAADPVVETVPAMLPMALNSIPKMPYCCEPEQKLEPVLGVMKNSEQQTMERPQWKYSEFVSCCGSLNNQADDENMRELAVETARTSVKRLSKSVSRYKLKKQETCQLQVGCATKIEKTLESETIPSFSMDEDKLDRKLDQKSDSSIKAYEMLAPKLDRVSCSVLQVNKIRMQHLPACVRATDEKDVEVNGIS